MVEESTLKIALLEQKIVDFYNVSSRIENAIAKLSDVNSNISKMLAVHEERIEQCNKSDDLIIKMIDHAKDENTKQHQEVNKRIDKLEIMIEEVAKFRWMMAGVFAVIVLVAPIIGDFVTSTLSNQNQIHRVR